MKKFLVAAGASLFLISGIMVTAESNKTAQTPDYYAGVIAQTPTPEMKKEKEKKEKGKESPSPTESPSPSESPSPTESPSPSPTP